MTDIILYTTPQGNINIAVRFQEDTFWLTQKAMAELFGTTPQNITLHLKNIFADAELQEQTTCKDFLQVQTEGARQVERNQKFYNLDAVIAVGYRVNSKQATQFRIWATNTLKEYIIKGFVLDDERLKQGKQFGKDYFDELLARIREIRTSEKRFYQKIRDLFMLSTDYDKTNKQTELFFATVQNKLLYATTQHTAAEIITTRAVAELPNMGLTSFKGSRVRKEDIYIAKNYLTEDEIDTLNRLVALFLDTAELRVKDQIALNLNYWQTEADKVIAFSNKPILNNTGSISHADMEKTVTQTYTNFNTNRKQIEAQQADAEEELAIEKLLKKAKNK